MSLLFCQSSYSQSKKDVIKDKIKSIKVVTTVYKNEIQTQIPEIFERYAPNGDVIEKIEYDKEGKVKSHEAFVYNKKGDVVERIYDERQLEKEESLTYASDGVKTGKQV
jgi:antitoxin component YwqK of YwqJK toxin-antitoxin module